MMSNLKSSLRILISLGLLLVATGSQAQVMEIFAKGSASKSNLSTDKHTISISAAGGLAITLIPRVRIEGRYTNISSLQNKLDIAGAGTLNDIMSQSSIYSVGIDLDLLGERSAFQPFIYVGAGYVHTERSYYFVPQGTLTSIFLEDPVQTGISANLGAGFRIRIANALAFEVECFAYGVDVHKPNPLINMYGNVGIRIFI